MARGPGLRALPEGTADTHVSHLLLQQPVFLLELLHGRLDRGLPACLFRLQRGLGHQACRSRAAEGKDQTQGLRSQVPQAHPPLGPGHTPPATITGQQGKRLSPLSTEHTPQGHGATGQAWPWPGLTPSKPSTRGHQTLGQFHAGSGVSHPKPHPRAALGADLASPAQRARDRLRRTPNHRKHWPHSRGSPMTQPSPGLGSDAD